MQCERACGAAGDEIAEVPVYQRFLAYRRKRFTLPFRQTITIRGNRAGIDPSRRPGGRALGDGALRTARHGETSPTADADLRFPGRNPGVARTGSADW
jgi:hypothetical protein